MTVLSEAELAAVARFLAAQGVTPRGALTATYIAGGRSNLTFRLTDGEGNWALRMPPRVGRTPSAHDVAREYRVIAALDKTDVPVPPAVALCEDEWLLAGPFAVTEWVTGHSVQSRGALDELDDVTVAALVARLVATLAELHRLDHVAVGLGDFGRPGNYGERQLRRWSGQWDLVGASGLGAFATELIVRLTAALPAQRATSLLHGDFRIDNTLLRLGAGPSVAAVVDWELSTVGDPVADVAMMCAYRDRVFDLVIGSQSAWTSDRIPSVEALAAAYEAAGGATLVDWQFHLALAYFKIGVIAAGIDHRWRAGAASGPGFDTSGASVPRYFELARSALG